jgi:hypothetical protein
MKNLLRAAAIAIASTALIAGAATAPASAAPGDGVSANLAIQPATLTGYPNISTTYINLAIGATPGVEVTSIRGTINVNGVPVENNAFISPISGFAYQQAYGAGVVSITNAIGQGYDSRDGTRRAFSGKPIALAPNGAQVRYGIDYKSKIRVQKRGKKLTFRLTARYINNAGRPVGIRKATIQVKRGGKWKNLKHVKLKKSGTGTYKKSDKKKRNYRMVIKTTGTYQGGNTQGTRKL